MKEDGDGVACISQSRDEAAQSLDTSYRLLVELTVTSVATISKELIEVE